MYEYMHMILFVGSCYHQPNTHTHPTLTPCNRVGAYVEGGIRFVIAEPTTRIMYAHMYIYIYIYICLCTCICKYIYAATNMHCVNGDISIIQTINQ